METATRRKSTKTATQPIVGLALGVAGSHVAVLPSSIAGCGNGLFALHDLPRNTHVTWHDGVVLDREEAAARAAVDPSFLRSVGFHTVIDGLRVPTAGRGAASFCQHAATPALRNVKTVDVFDKASHATQSVLVTPRDVDEGEELFTDYGRHYWIRAGVTPRDPPT